MIKNLHIFIFSALLLLFSSCAEQSAEERYGLNPQAGSGGGLGGGGNSVLTKTQTQGGSTVDYYSTNGILYKVVDVYAQNTNTYQLKYNSAGKVDSIVHSTPQGISNIAVYEYNGDRIKKVKVKTAIQLTVGSGYDEVDYTYDNVGRVTQVIYKHWNDVDDEFYLYHKNIFTYASGNNISKWDLYHGDIENGIYQPGNLMNSTTWGSFDTMRSPYSTLNKSAFIALAAANAVTGSYVNRTSPNNPLTINVIFNGLPTIPGGGYTYTYNTDGLPTGNGGETYTYGPLQ